MRRISVVSVSAVIVFASLMIGVGRLAGAQDVNPGDHPARGSWNVTSDPGDTEYAPRLVMLSADGGAFFVSGEKLTGVGAWEPTGETTAIVTFTVVTNGPAQIVTRAAIEVSADGQAFTGTFTNEAVVDPVGGITSGELGPGTLTGTRMVAEAPGTPVETFDEFFALPGATPEASPEG